MSGSDCRDLAAVVGVSVCLQLLSLCRVLRQSSGRTQMQTDWWSAGDDAGVRRRCWFLLKSHKSKRDDDRWLVLC